MDQTMLNIKQKTLNLETSRNVKSKNVPEKKVQMVKDGSKIGKGLGCKLQI